MFSNLKQSVLVLTLGLVCATTTDAAQADPLETPLPAGAVMRLGTTRFRTGSGGLGQMKLSHDGKLLVTSGTGNGLIVWDAGTGKRLMRLPLGQEGEISRDGKRLFVIESQPAAPAKPFDPKAVFTGKTGHWAELKCDLNVYEIGTGKLVRSIRTEQPLAHIALAPDEQTLALQFAIPNVWKNEQDFAADWFYKTRVELYDLKADRITHKLGELPQNYANNGLLLFSADGKTLFAVSSSRENKDDLSTVRGFDVASGALKSKTTIVGAGYRTILNSNDKTLITTDGKIWDLDKGRVHFSSKGALGHILAFMANERKVAGWVKKDRGLDSSSMVQWDLETDREIGAKPAKSFSTISPDGKTCYGVPWPYQRWIRWDFETGKELDPVQGLPQPAEQIAFSPDGKYVATYGWIWDRATGKRVFAAPGPLGTPTPVFFTPDSKTLVVGAQSMGTPPLCTVDVTTWKQGVRDFEMLRDGQFQAYTETTNAVLSPDGKALAAPAGLWDWASKNFLGKLEHHLPDGTKTSPTVPLAFSADSKQVICLGYPDSDKRVQAWNVADRKLVSDNFLADWPKEQEGFRGFQFVADGKLLVGIWLAPQPPWRGMLFPKGKGKAIPADLPATKPPIPDAVVRVWDSATGKEKFRIQYPQDQNSQEMLPVCSPDGKLLVTASYYDEIVHIRDLTSGKELGRINLDVKGAHWLAFSPDSQALAISAKDTTVLLVDVQMVLRKP